MAFIRKFPVLTFVMLTLGFQVSIVLIAFAMLPKGTHLHNHPEAHMVFRLRVFGPLFFAMMITYIIEKKEGLRRLFRGYLNWKVNPKWYLLAFSWKFVFSYIGIGAAVLFGFTTWPGWVVDNFFGGDWSNFKALLAGLPFIVGIALVEETSWIKFCVTRMQEKYSAFVSCLIIGICWGLWYLPMLLIGEGVPDGIPPLFFMLSMFSLTLLLAWTYNMTHSGLVLLVMQIISNCAFFILPVLPGWWGGDPTYVTAFVIANFSMAMIITFVYGPKELGTKPRAKWSES